MSDVMLAQKWSDEDPSGWWLSEKLDGVRALWRNGRFVSRGDNSFNCPDWFLKRMPMGVVLDGEIWGGRGQFQKTVGIVKSSSRSSEWEFLTYMVFDVLQDCGANLEYKPFEERLAAAQRICGSGGGDGARGDGAVLKAVPMQKCSGREHLQEVLQEVERAGGEGVMLRKPRSTYEHKRSASLLKVKTFHDEEAIVMSHDRGRGRNADVCGALVCRTPDGRQFKVGSGLSDDQRQDPPKVGAVITYRYQELTAANMPRFPTLVSERFDLDWEYLCAGYVPPVARREAALKKKHSILFDGPTTISALTVSEKGQPRPCQLHRPLSRLDILQLGAAEEDLEDLFDDPSQPSSDTKRVKTSPSVCMSYATGCVVRPVCVYGTKCYRTNPSHFIEFSHPWEDEENIESKPAPSRVGSSGCAVEPTRVSGASIGSASALEMARPVAGVGLSSMLLSSRTFNSADVFKAPHLSAVVEQFEVCPAIDGTVSAPKLDAIVKTTPIVSEGCVVLCSKDPDSTAAESKCATLASNTYGVGDVRICALRSLLQSLAQDSTSAAEREHFANILNLVEAGPDTSSSSCTTPNGPPMPASSDIGVAIGLAASERLLPPPTLLSGSGSVSIFADEPRPPPMVAPTSGYGAEYALPAAAAAVVLDGRLDLSLHQAEARVVGEEVASRDSAVMTLQNMGFARSEVEDALGNCGGSIDEALEWLLANAAATA